MGWRDIGSRWFSKTTQFVTSTTTNLWTNVTTLPSVGWHYMANGATLQISQSMLHIIVEDLLPYIFLHQAVQNIEGYLAENEEEDNPSTWTAYWTLQTVSSILQTSLFIYSIRQRARLTARTAVLTLENNSAWPNLRETKPFTICEEEGCTQARFIQGILRDLGIFYLTEMGIHAINFVPVVGPVTSTGLSIYHRGRYALATIMPEVCQRHQIDYLDSHPSLTMSLGLLHYGSLVAASHTIGYVGNMPAADIASMIDYLLMMPTIATAARLKLPLPVKHNPTPWRDPLAYYERFMGWWIDVVLYGLKKQAPKLLKGPRSDIDLVELYGQFRTVKNHPISQFAAMILIADCFHSVDRLRQDPVIKHLWTKLCLGIAEAAREIVSWGQSYTLNLLATHDVITDMSASIAHWYKRYPESAVKIAIHAITNTKVQEWLISLAEYLEQHSDVPNEAPENWLKGKFDTLTHLIERSLNFNHQDAYQASLMIADAILYGTEPVRESLGNRVNTNITPVAQEPSSSKKPERTLKSPATSHRPRSLSGNPDQKRRVSQHSMLRQRSPYEIDGSTHRENLTQGMN